MMEHLSDFQLWLHPELQKPVEEGKMTLADMHVNEHAKVLELCCGKMAMNRLISLGFTPGAEISMTQNYGRGPLIVSVRGGRVAIGRGEAKLIRVEHLHA
jgi:ferrous iron transport protein A